MNQNQSAPLLELKNLQVFFKTSGDPARAVDDISFSIYPGETFALVGESGSGKSVTSLAIMQLLQKPAGYIAGGEVLFNGQTISTLSPVQMRKIRGNSISMIFQEPMTALNPVMTVGDQICEVVQLHRHMNRKEARQYALSMLEMVGIPAPNMRIDEYPHQLSGGMRQRVMIAIALACKPQLLIADEPTTALDVTIQTQILDLIKRLQRENNSAVLLITHDMGVVREYADRVGVMYGGKLVEVADCKTLFEKPAHPYTELLMRALPTIKYRGKQLETIEGLVPKATQKIMGCRFYNRCPLVLPHCGNSVIQECLLNKDHRVLCHLFNQSEMQQRKTITVDLKNIPARAKEDDQDFLKVDHLCMHFPIRRGIFQRQVGAVKAVDGVSFTLKKGETLALVGESGCGKTTVGKSIVRLLDPNSGHVFLNNGVDLTQLSQSAMKKYRAKIQFVFQDPYSSLNPRMLIGDMLVECMETHGIGLNRMDRLERARALLSKVGLDPDMANRYPHEFSGGQRQRVVLARSLTPNPDLLICDEATSALDVSVQAQILNLLKQLQAEFNYSYIFITHNLSVVEYLADRVAVMYLGRIVEEGTTEEIFQNPKHPYTQALLSSAPKLDPDSGIQKIVLEGDVPSPVNPPKGCFFHPRCRHVQPFCSQEYPSQISFSKTHKCNCHFATKTS